MSVAARNFARQCLRDPQWRAVARKHAAYVVKAMRVVSIEPDRAAARFAADNVVLPSLGRWLIGHAREIYCERFGGDRYLVAALREGSYPFLDSLARGALPLGVNGDNPAVRQAVAAALDRYRAYLADGGEPYESIRRNWQGPPENPSRRFRRPQYEAVAAAIRERHPPRFG